jgi:ribosomal protein S12 methylthiotransferase accessory factor
MESLEQFHAERIDRPIALGTYRERTKKHRIADVRRLSRLRPLDPDARILWIGARDLGKEESIDVPFELVHLDLREPLPEGSGFFALSSNGLASGSTLVEALAHALAEVIERDALALFYQWHPEQQALSLIRLRTIDDPTSQKLLERFDAAGVGVAVWDMTSDLEIPAFLCSIGERELDVLRRVGVARGYGCHPDKNVALRRALTEAAQSRLTRIAGSRDDIQAEDLRAIRSPESILRQRAYVEQESLATRDFRAIPRLECATQDEALARMRARLHEGGFDVLYVDLSSPSLPVAIVRVIVPGLEGLPDAPGYLPGARARAAAAASQDRGLQASRS